jgi:5-methylcytosine-specific restriction endonuclease McrA
MNLMRRPTLMLNASYEPLRIIWARKALTLLTKGVAVVEVPTSTMVYPGIYLPSVIRLRVYKHVPIRMQTVSRKNIFMRDGYQCMYCGQSSSGAGLELEHIVPKSRGGKNEWSNLVAACRKCNSRKNDRTPEEAGMRLIRRPLPANIHTPRFILKSLGAEIPSWGRYLFNDSEGEQRLVARG